MPRPTRYAPGGMVFHVLNRAALRRNLFECDADFAAFERILWETLRACPMRIVAYCLMSNHWHMVLWPERDDDLPSFMQRLTNTHVKRWKEHRHEVGLGPLYQGRYKSFPVQADDYFYQVVRYVERNPLRANLVPRAEEWRWSSLVAPAHSNAPAPLLADWPLPKPAHWLDYVNSVQTEGELSALRECVQRGTPYGNLDWINTTSERLHLNSTLHSPGRPRRS